MDINTLNQAAVLHRELTVRLDTVKQLEKAASYGSTSSGNTCINLYHGVHDQVVDLPHSVLEVMIIEGINRTKCEIAQIKLQIDRLK